MAHTVIHYIPRPLLRHSGTRSIRLRCFATSARHSLNPLLNLSALSGSKEAQFLSREKRIPRTEFSSYLELIRSSEVDPFAPVAGASPTVVAALKKAQTGEGDLLTTYSLALTNLMQQLETSRYEARRASLAFDVLQHRHQKQERHAFIAMLAVVALVSLAIAKPDWFNETKQILMGEWLRWRGFDWQWLGNPPAHKVSANQHFQKSAVLATNAAEPVKPVGIKVDEHIDDVINASASNERERYPAFLSQLFWATPK